MKQRSEVKELDEKSSDREWLLENLSRPATFKDRVHFYLQTRLNTRPYKSFRYISIKGGYLPKLFLYNGLVNSKYNIFTFVPLVLYAQFRAFINLFYLAMCLSQLIPILRVESPIVHMFPLALVIFVFSLKEGFEDYKRHVRDKEHNTQKFSIYRDNQYKEESSEKLKLGQILALRQGQRVPADILLLKTSEPNGASFVRTDQLDGETDWKLKRAVATTQMKTVDEISSLESVVTVEDPKPDFYNFSGKITFYNSVRTNEDAENVELSKDDCAVVVESLNVDNVVWMNSIVASGTIHGLIIYVGRDARACLNSKRSRAKYGLFDRELNKLFTILIVLMLCMCILMLAPTGFAAKWYITFLKYLLLFSTIVPLSLRISLDIAKYVYNRSIVLDKKIPHAMPRTTMIPEELGRVQYLLSDKTGTLTQNVISLEKLYVSRGFYTNEDVPIIQSKTVLFLGLGVSKGGRKLRPPGERANLSSHENIASPTRANGPDDGTHTSGSSLDKAEPAVGSATADALKGGSGSGDPLPKSEVSLEQEADKRTEEEIVTGIFGSGVGETLESRLCLALLSMAICHNVRPITATDEDNIPSPTPNTAAAAKGEVKRSSSGVSGGSERRREKSMELDPHFYDGTEKGRGVERDALVEGREDGEDVAVDNQSGPLDEKESTQGDDVEFQASSPDEIALVKFAHQCGVKLVERDDYGMTLMVHGLPLKFKILFMIPFSSETKRMGIIVEDAAGKKHFFIKGAEVAIIPFLLPRGSVWLSEECDNLARMGLRTLVFAYRPVSNNEFRTFMAKYHEANVSLEDRVKKIKNVTATLEHDLNLVGLTGVRDQLQKNVGATLESLRNAGIKIWMLTGDKIDTAKCVAISAGLKQRHHTVYQISVESLVNPEINRVGNSDILREESVEKEVIDFINGFNLDNYTEDSPERENYDNCMSRVTLIIEKRLENFAMGPTDSVLILDSFVISIALASLSKLFVKSATMATSVLCCRCTPQMKADIVKLLRSKKQIVCSIGDGDNDVPMITEANVGIGIVGKEGLQASLSSDYSLVEFSHLKRLLLWHGRNSYKRSSNMSHFLMHRGVIISVMQAIFSSIYYFMPIAFFQGWLLVGFTSYYNMIPIFCLVLDEEICEEDVLLFPELYHELRRGRVMNVKTFLIWIWISIFQGAVLMTGAIILFENSLVSLIGIGCTALFLLEIFNLVGELHNWHRLTIIGIMSTSVVYFYSLLVFRNNFDMEFIARKSFFWKVLVISLLGWLPVYLVKWLTKLLKPPQYVKLIVS